MYQIVFCSGNYTCVDAEATTYEQAEEIRNELQAQMYMSGERDFYYIIREVKERN